MADAGDAVAEEVVRRIPGFAASPELEAAGRPPRRADVVADALGRYLLRLQRAEIRRRTDRSEGETLDRGYALLEELAGREEEGVPAFLAVALDRLHGDDVAVAAVETRLGPRAAGLYRRWAV